MISLAVVFYCRIGSDNLTSPWSLESVTVEAPSINSKWEFPILQELTPQQSQCDADLPSSMEGDVGASKRRGFKLRLPEINWPNFGDKSTSKQTGQKDQDSKTKERPDGVTDLSDEQGLNRAFSKFV